MQSSGAQDVVRRAIAAFNSGRHDKATRLCEQALIRQPQEPTLLYLLASVLCARNDFASARVHVDASLKVAPKNASALLLAGRIARAENKIEAALAYFKRAAELGVNTEILLETARTLDQAGSSARAREVWRAILKAIPDCKEALARAGRLAWQDGAHAEAAALLERAATNDGPASVWFDLGLAKQDLLDHAGAVTAYRRALEAKPDDAEAAFNLGVALQETGDLDLAIDAYRAAFRLRPSMFGTIAMALTSAPYGKLWIEESALRYLLAG
jgi:tetratricopeptide (TPR) repeat protein